MNRSGAPHVIEAVERASRRATAAAHRELARGLFPLRTIASSATLVGLLGSLLQMYFRTFYTCGGSLWSCNAPVAARLAQALDLTVAGLFVSILSFCFYGYLSSQIETFDLEMENARVELVNRLAGFAVPSRISIPLA